MDNRGTITALMLAALLSMTFVGCDMLTLPSDKADQPGTDVTDDPTVDPNATVQAGLDLMIARKMDDAKLTFGAVALRDPTNQDAKVWSALLDLAAINVDPKTVAFYQSKIGVQDYPSTMDEYLGNTWLNATVYNTTEGFVAVASNGEWVRGYVTPSSNPGDEYETYDAYGDWVEESGIFTPDPNGDTYSDYWNVSGQGSNYGDEYLSEHPGVQGYDYDYNLLDLTRPQMFPALSPVTGFNPALTNGGYSPSDYSMLLLYNIMTRNPAGANAAVDALLAGPYGSKMDSIIERLDAIEMTTRTDVPRALLTSYMGDPASTGGPELPTVSIGKPELLVISAQLKMQKAFLQYLASVNLSYDVTSVYSLFKIVNAPNYTFPDNNNNGVADVFETFWSQAPGVYSSDLLTSRSTAERAASQASFVAALADLSTAFGAWRTALNDSSSYYSQTLATYLAAGQDNTSALTTVDNLKTATDKLSAAILGGSTLYVPTEVTAQGMWDLNVVLGSTLTWPTAAGAGVFGVNPGAVWASNVLDFRSWVEGTAANGFTLYWVPTWAEDANWEEVAAPFSSVAYKSTLTAADLGLDGGLNGIEYMDIAVALKVKNSRIQEFVADYPSDAPALYYPMYSHSAVDNGELNLTVPAAVPLVINWLNK